MHTCTHAHMHTCTHAHMHTCMQPRRSWCKNLFSVPTSSAPACNPKEGDGSCAVLRNIVQPRGSRNVVVHPGLHRPACKVSMKARARPPFLCVGPPLCDGTESESEPPSPTSSDSEAPSTSPLLRRNALANRAVNEYRVLNHVARKFVARRRLTSKSRRSRAIPARMTPRSLVPRKRKLVTTDSSVPGQISPSKTLHLLEEFETTADTTRCERSVPTPAHDHAVGSSNPNPQILSPPGGSSAPPNYWPRNGMFEWDPCLPPRRFITTELPVVCLFPLWAFACTRRSIRRDREIRGYWPSGWKEWQWALIMSACGDPKASEVNYINGMLRAIAASRPAPQPPYQVTALSRLPAKRIIGLALYRRPDPTGAFSPWDVAPTGYQLPCHWRVIRLLRFSKPINAGHKMNQGVPKPLKSWSKMDPRLGARVLGSVLHELERGTYTWVQ